MAAAQPASLSATSPTRVITSRRLCPAATSVAALVAAVPGPGSSTSNCFLGGVAKGAVTRTSRKLRLLVPAPRATTSTCASELARLGVCVCGTTSTRLACKSCKQCAAGPGAAVTAGCCWVVVRVGQSDSLASRDRNRDTSLSQARTRTLRWFKLQWVTRQLPCPAHSSFHNPSHRQPSSQAGPPACAAGLPVSHRLRVPHRDRGTGNDSRS